MASRGEATGSKAATAAAKVLKDPKASADAKKVAASALSQLKSGASASQEAAKAAAKILKDPKSSKEAKIAAASALTQKPAVSVDDATAKRVRSAVDRLMLKKSA
jgi:hypothetical protein